MKLIAQFKILESLGDEKKYFQQELIHLMSKEIYKSGVFKLKEYENPDITDNRRIVLESTIEVFSEETHKSIIKDLLKLREGVGQLAKNKIDLIIHKLITEK